MPSLLPWVRVSIPPYAILCANEPGPRNRAPLGMKTTNAKAKGFQTPGPVQDKEIEKTQKPLTSNRKPKRLIHADTIKLEVHGDESPLAQERDVEYCPPKSTDLPYESDTFPDGCLDYSAFKPGNMMRGVFKKKDLGIDENGLTRMDREMEAAYQKAAKAGDEAILAAVEEEWAMGDVPETLEHMRKKSATIEGQKNPAITNLVKKPLAMKSKGPATINSRRAASALSVAPKSNVVAPRISKPAPKPSFLSRPKAPSPINISSTASSMRAAAAVATSRSTIGHTKGRSVSGLMQKTQQSAPVKSIRSGLTRSVSTMSTMSTASDTTITPARFARKDSERDCDSPAFMRAFDVEDDELDLRRGLADCLRREEEEEEEFVMPLPADL